MSAHALAAPLHRHLREDEYSYVLEGRMGALLGDDVLEAGPGDLVFKPRDQWHTFWNAGDEPAGSSRSSPPPASSASSPSSSTSAASPGRPGELGELCERYELEMDPDERPGAVERFGVRFPGGAARALTPRGPSQWSAGTYPITCMLPSSVRVDSSSRSSSGQSA